MLVDKRLNCLRAEGLDQDAENVQTLLVAPEELPIGGLKFLRHVPMAVAHPELVAGELRGLW